MQRAARLQLLREIVASSAVSSQDAIVELLADRGVQVTQATLSRDLRELGAVKTQAGYQLPGESIETPARPTATVGLAGTGSLRRAVAGHLIGVRPGVGMVVCKTSPGHAQVLALEFDRTPPPGVIGTVGGDDTVFVAVESPSRVATLTAELVDMAGFTKSEALS